MSALARRVIAEVGAAKLLNDGLDYATMSRELAQDLCGCFVAGTLSYASVERMRNSHRLDCSVRRWLYAHPEHLTLP